jgi:hypothetical protein
MADNFNLSKFIRNNPLLNESIGGYRDIKPMREEESIEEMEEEVSVSSSGVEMSGVKELKKPDLIYNEDWMNDSIDGKKVGKWTCYYENHLHVLYWLHDDISSEDLVVYATPNWDGAKGIAFEVQLDAGGDIIDQDTIGEPSYPDFESYAETVAPALQSVEAKYKSGGYDEYLSSKDTMEEGADFASFYNDKIGVTYDNYDNPIGGYKKYTIVSTDPANQTITAKDEKGNERVFGAWKFGQEFTPMSSPEQNWQNKYGPGADRFN